MKGLLSFLAGFLLVSQAWGQQRPQYSQYMINNYLLNPAISGIEDYTDVKIGSRHQWVGLDGAPVTYYVSAHTPLNKQATQVRSVGKGIGRTHKTNVSRLSKPQPHQGVGIMALTDKTGPLRRSNIMGTYAYHLPISREFKVAVGVGAGMLNSRFNPSEATMVIDGDPAITSDYVNYTYFDLNVGTWIYSKDFFLGLSGAQLLKSRGDLNAAENGSRLQKHYFATIGYRFQVSQDLTLIPSTMIKMASPSPVSVDINLRALYADRLWVGGSYRNKDSFSVLAGVYLNQLLDLSYAYDINTSNLGVANSGSHEVVVGLKLFNKGRVICPIYMR
ncbi:PorP/SprF family type IX secretion system membrane protein [Adhaeribacter aquaticus]|uniref:PorP/SprF family type IX secretion system membrane protein n=1 Tax=Adhaeribacter aquaticus TaxID=299567 RepID=UPI0003F94DC3|nr:type IX secretion system membrane protein PorP/SprF [Adhaeribacter aquaticus]